jgi:hypothetical protein
VLCANHTHLTNDCTKLHLHEHLPQCIIASNLFKFEHISDIFRTCVSTAESKVAPFNTVRTKDNPPLDCTMLWGLKMLCRQNASKALLLGLLPS